MSIANVNTNPAASYAAQSSAETSAVREQAAPSSLDARQAIADVQARAAESAESKPSLEEIQAATATLGEYIDVVSRSLNIKVDSDLREPIVTVLDADTDEVVRQIPSEELVAIAKFLRAQEAAQGASEEALTGVLLRQAT